MCRGLRVLITWSRKSLQCRASLRLPNMLLIFSERGQGGGGGEGAEGGGGGGGEAGERKTFYSKKTGRPRKKKIYFPGRKGVKMAGPRHVRGLHSGATTGSSQDRGDKGGKWGQ